MVWINITVIKKKLDNFRSEYGEIVNFSEISIRIDKIYDVWNEYDIETVPEKNRGKYLSSLPTDDDRTLSVSRKLYKKFKDNFTNHKRKHNMGLNL